MWCYLSGATEDVEFYFPLKQGTIVTKKEQNLIFKNRLKTRKNLPSELELSGKGSIDVRNDGLQLLVLKYKKKTSLDFGTKKKQHIAILDLFKMLPYIKYLKET